jgi:hypothetical protein
MAATVMALGSIRMVKEGGLIRAFIMTNPRSWQLRQHGFPGQRPLTMGDEQP